MVVEKLRNNSIKLNVNLVCRLIFVSYMYRYLDFQNLFIDFLYTIHAQFINIFVE